jgi:hypothetical protein
MGTRGDISVDEPSGQRWQAAIEMLGEGAIVRVAGLLLYLDRDKSGKPWEGAPLIVEIPANAWHDLSRERQEQIAASMLKEAQKRFAGLEEASTELRDLVGGRELTFELVDDYGNGAVRLATLEEEQVRLA